jgi:hypothetical protein
MDAFEALAAEAGKLSARLQELSAFTPSPATAADVDRLLAFREHHGKLDGPAVEPRDLQAVSRGATRPFDAVTWQAQTAVHDMLESAEQALVALSRQGVGLVNGRDLGQNWFHFEYGNRPMIGVNPSRLPPEHVLHAVAERYNGNALVLGPGEYAAGEGAWGGRLLRPRSFYSVSDCRRWTAVCEKQRVIDAAEQERVSEALAARQRALDEERERADPVRRMAALERQVESLKREREPCPS